jgi:hypothetical protein
MGPLLHPKDMLRIEGVDIPNDLYQILDTPPLAGMRYPRWSPPWSRLKAAGFQYVVKLHEGYPKYDPAPLTLLHSVRLQDLIGGGSPQDPEREERLIRKTVNIILKKLALGEGVVVHCEGGRGRTGTVLGCVLRGLGFSSSEVISYLDSLHQARGKPAPAWPESRWQSKLVEHYCD